MIIAKELTLTKCGTVEKIEIDLLMLIATSLMAIFALFSWLTALVQNKSQKILLKEQQKSQTYLLNKQNDIQQKQLKLALLKEKQEIRESFRCLIIDERTKMERIIYHCEKMGIIEFRTNMNKNYLVIVRMRDLFGRQFEYDVKKIIQNFENILSWETNQISELRLFEKGFVHHDREKNIPESELRKYKEVYDKNVRWLLEANKYFSEILEKLTADIDKITRELKDDQQCEEWEVIGIAN